jgi:hypothetical protein
VRFLGTVTAILDKPGLGQIVDCGGTATILGDGPDAGRIALTGWSRGVALEGAALSIGA